MKKVGKVIGRILLCVIIIILAVLIFYTVREYRPAAVEKVEASSGSKTLQQGSTFTIASWNTGYAGLGEEEDFFMDGGTKVQPDSKEEVQKNLTGIAKQLKDLHADFYFLQEVDRNCKRSYHMDELAFYEQALGIPGMYACNFRCDFVPYPLPPIGKVEAGLVTMTDYQVSEASRIALPESFKWPVKTCNLKRCMLETRIPVEGTDRELVLINFHLEAYDSGEGKVAQMKQLSEKLKEEYAKGNYVIAGGDFNQTFEGMDNIYEVKESDDWAPGVIETEDIPEGFSMAAADNVPTCRHLNEPYNGSYEDSDVYVIDGFLVSDNLNVAMIRNVDTGFAYSDHQPVQMQITMIQ